jgi:excisionase family DNA binding protein
MAKTMTEIPDRLLSVQDVAALLQIPIKTIYDWRCRGVGPRPIRMGRYLRFDPADVARWVEQRRTVS